MAYASSPGDYPRLALYRDGNWGPGTVYAFQYRMRKEGFYSSAYALDGVEGIQTRKAMQRFLAAKGCYSGLIDGSIKGMAVDGIVKWLAKYRGYYIVDYSRVFPQALLVGGWQGYLNEMRTAILA